MGKLHTLKRAILREPEKWIRSWYYPGAYFDKKTGIWHPSYHYYSYRKFVIYTLKTNGYL